MRLIFLFPMLLICYLLQAQDSLDIKNIDSIVRAISQQAATKSYRVVEGSLLLEGNKTSSIRFHLKENIPEIIVVESSPKDHVTLYYFSDRKLLYVANFANGNYNEIESAYYFSDDTAYRKEDRALKKVNPAIFTTQVASYFDLFREQLKGR